MSIRQKIRSTRTDGVLPDRGGAPPAPGGTAGGYGR